MGVELNLGNCLGISDRMVFSPRRAEIKNSNWHRFLDIFHLAPCFYTEENRTSIACFQRIMIRLVGAVRFQRIAEEYGLDFTAMSEKGRALTSRDVAKIMVGVRNVTCTDMQELIQAVKRREAWTRVFPPRILSIIRRVDHFVDLSPSEFDLVYKALQYTPFKVPRITKKISGKPTEVIARHVHDHFLEVREIMQLCEVNRTLSPLTFIENLCKTIIQRELSVGTIIPGHLDALGRNQVYYRVTARVITARGRVCYYFAPATNFMEGKTISADRSSKFRPSELDSCSTLIDDAHADIGIEGYNESLIYKIYLHEGLPPTYRVAGFSLGAVYVQRDIAKRPIAEHQDDTREVFLFNSPGTTREVVDRFNRRMRDHPYEMHIYIQKTDRDFVNDSGELMIGHNAPRNATTTLHEFYLPKSKLPINPHNIVYGVDTRDYSISCTNTAEALNRELDHSNSRKEKFRRFVGRILVPLLKLIRAISRAIFGSRAEQLRGLDIERLTRCGYKVQHISSEEARERFSRHPFPSPVSSSRAA